MDLDGIERELRDIWAEIALLQAATTFPAGDFQALKEDLDVLRLNMDFNQIDLVDFICLSERIQGIEENLRLLSQDFNQFKEIMVFRLNAMAIEAVNHERRTVNNEHQFNTFVHNHFNTFVHNHFNTFTDFANTAFRRFSKLERDAAHLRSRVNALAQVEANQLMNASSEETIIIQEM